MAWLKKLFNQNMNLPALLSGGIKETEYIPEPTRSLLFITDESPSKAASPMTITVVVNIPETGVSIGEEDHHNFYGEPSLIWKQLPLRRNQELARDPIYYPKYTSLTPDQRFQYLSWLKDISQPTNLSYVFLYYYGLERHLLVGDYDKAVKEIFRLLQHHDKGSFRAYAQDALIATALFHKRLDIFDQYPFLFQGISNDIFLMRRHLRARITAKEITELVSNVGFTNKRYLKLYPSEFETEINQLLAVFEKEHGSILETVPWEDLVSEKTSTFANFSLSENIRTIRTPQLLYNDTFQSLLREMLQTAHNNLKERLKNKMLVQNKPD